MMRSRSRWKTERVLAFRLGMEPAAALFGAAGVRGERRRNRHAPQPSNRLPGACNAGPESARGNLTSWQESLNIEAGQFQAQLLGGSWRKAATSPPERQVSLTESAARRIAELRIEENAPNAFLRLAVSGGGCSGFQYGFSFDDTRQDDDVVFERDGVELVIDEVSLELVKGAEIDFVEDMMGAYFQVRNPNAASSCGCGNSFSVG